MTTIEEEFENINTPFLSREKKCVKGVHRNVSRFDFCRLYPHLIMEYNICPSTYAPEDASDEDCNIITLKSGKVIRFYKSHIKEGTVPLIYRDLIRLSNKIRHTMKNDFSNDEDTFFYSTRTELKRIWNKMYTMLPILYKECVISLANDMMRSVSDHFEAHGMKTIYYDEDAIMVTGDNAQSVPLDNFPNLEYDFTCDVILYGYNKYHIYPGGRSRTCGFSGKLRFKFYNDLYNKLVEKVFNDQSYTYKDMLADIFSEYQRLINGDYDKNDFIFSSIYSGNYASENFYMKIYGEMLKAQGREITNGTSLSYFVTDTTVNDLLGNRMRDPSSDDPISVNYYMKSMTLINELFGFLYGKKGKYIPPCEYFSKVIVKDLFRLEQFLKYYE